MLVLPLSSANQDDDDADADVATAMSASGPAYGDEVQFSAEDVRRLFHTEDQQADCIESSGSDVELGSVHCTCEECKSLQLKTINTTIHIQDAEHEYSTKPAISSGPPLHVMPVNIAKCIVYEEAMRRFNRRCKYRLPCTRRPRLHVQHDPETIPGAR